MSDSTIPLKRCTRCNEEKSVTTEYFARCKSRYDGFQGVCKSCQKAQREQKRDEMIDYLRQWREANAEYLHKYRQQYRREHREYCAKYNSEYQRKNRKRINQQNRARYAKNPLPQLTATRRWIEANPERNRETCRKRARRLYRSSAKIRANKHLQRHRRMARQKALQSDFTHSDIQYMLDYFNNCCAICGRASDKVSGLVIACDHWIPLSYRGADNPGTVPSNMIPLCHGIGGCNNSKGNKLPGVWLTERFSKDSAAEILQRIQAYFKTVRR